VYDHKGKDKKRELALNRIKQAEESLEEAEYLFDGKKTPRSVINRAYYAMFYAILALLIFEKVQFLKALRCSFIF